MEMDGIRSTPAANNEHLMRNKIIVTGGFGFLGTHTVNTLSQAFGSDHVLPFSRRSNLDLFNEETSIAFLKKFKPDTVIHCAAHVGGIAYNRRYPIEVFYDNTRISLTIARACYEARVNTLINIMPNCTYPGELDAYEEHKWWDGEIHESVLTYGLPRKMLWGACFAFCQKDPHFKPVHLIFPNMYGPGDHFDSTRSHALGALVSKIVNAKRNGKRTVEIWGTGKPVREWLYVKDGATAILKTLENIDKFEPNEIMNIGVAKGISVLELALMIKEIVGWDGEFILQPDRPDGAMKKVIVARKMKTKLRWEPQTDFKKSLQETVLWYNEKLKRSNKKRLSSHDSIT